MSINLKKTTAAYGRVLGAVVATVILGAVSLTSPARADVISPDTGLSVTLGKMTVFIYYHPTKTGYQVVTTASNEDPDSIIRFVATLAPGQDAVVSVPRGLGEPALQVRLHRVGDQVEVEHLVS